MVSREYSLDEILRGGVVSSGEYSRPAVDKVLQRNSILPGVVAWLPVDKTFKKLHLTLRFKLFYYTETYFVRLVYLLLNFNSKSQLHKIKKGKL